MANIKGFLRVFVFAYITQLPIIITMWTITIFPEIVLKNFKKPASDIPSYASYFYTSFFYGLILGSLLWPYAIRYISKRNSIFLAIIA